MKRPRFYFSFRSPYSWLASRVLVERGLLGRFELVPYWSPDETTARLLHAQGGETLYANMSKAKHLYILQDVRRLTKKLGYAMAWPIDRDPWWELPHLAFLAARRLGRDDAFYWAITRARWERGEDVCTAPVVRRAAEEIGLDPETLLAAPDDAKLREEGALGLLRAYEDDVFGLPFFVAGHAKFWGFDRVSDLIDVVLTADERNADRPTQSPTVLGTEGRSYDNDVAGGCG